MADKSFAAFFSYVHADDEHDNGRLTAIRQWLEEEVSAQTGETFEIFQDRDDIHWGHAWEERINGTLDNSTFLIAVVTPRYLRSEYCRKEFERFIERESNLGRNDLILPLLYMDTPALSDKYDSVATAISTRQYADWRTLRFEPWTNPDVTKWLAQLAKMICEAMAREISPKFIAADTQTRQSTARQQKSAASRQAAEPERRTAVIEPPSLIVDPMPRRGDYTSISQAIKAAEPGTRILIRPGLYKDAIVLDKPLELIGDGPRNEIVVESRGANTILFKTEFGRVSNLTLRQVGEAEFFTVNIFQGRLELEDCDISGRTLSGIAIHDDADPRLRRNLIHDCKEDGVFIWGNGKGTLEDNDIFNNGFSGVEIKTGGDPTLRRNRIHDEKWAGVFVQGQGKGTLEDNDIFNNGLSGVEIKNEGDPTLRRNRIHEGNSAGVFVQENGKGTLEDNEIFNNRLSGVEIKSGGDPTLRRNSIHDGKSGGVFVQENGKGTLVDNDIFNNRFSGVEVKAGGNPALSKNRIKNNAESGIYIHDNGGGSFENNEITGNREPWSVDDSSKKNIFKSDNIEA